jgi:hypothetical protein
MHKENEKYCTHKILAGKGKSSLEDLHTDNTIILQNKSEEKFNLKFWNGFNWLRTG